MNDFKDSLVITCNDLYLTNGTLLDKYNQELTAKSETFSNTKASLSFSPVFNDSFKFNQSDKDDLLLLTKWLNDNIGDDTVIFKLEEPVIALKTVNE